jgi:hypothetical protein
VSPAGIWINDGAFTIADASGSSGAISVANGNQSLVLYVADAATATLASAITGAGSVTKEGRGALTLVGQDANAIYSSYIGGTFVDAGTVKVGGTWAFGAYTTETLNKLNILSKGLVVDECGVVDLNGINITITSLNSSYSSGGTNGTITDCSAATGSSTTLNIDVVGTPGLFAGTISGGNQTNSHKPIYLFIQSASGYPGLLMTLTGNNTYTGGTLCTGSLQIGDDQNAGSIGGSVQVDADLVFDIANATDTVHFTGVVKNSGNNSLVGVGAGTLVVSDNGGAFQFPVAIRVEGGTMQLDGSQGFSSLTTVIVDAGATLDINGTSPNIASVLANGRIVDSANPPGLLTVAGLIELGTGTISANLGGGATLLKADDGTGGTSIGKLSGANSFSGTVIDLIGVLSVESGTALGQLTDGVFVVNGATLQLKGGIAVASASVLFLQGDGVGGVGALDNKSGINYWSGPILLDNGASDTKIGSEAGALLLTRGIDGVAGGAKLSLGGAGDISTSSVGIGSHVGDVYDFGPGKWSDTSVDKQTGVMYIEGPVRLALLDIQPVFTSIVVAYGETLNLGGYIVTADSVLIDKGVIDVADGALIVAPSAFAFVPQGGQANEYMVNNVGKVEYGDAAIHDALAEGANYAAVTGTNGFWDGTRGILSSDAANNLNGTTAVGWIDNYWFGGYFTYFRGTTVSQNQGIISYAYYADALLQGLVTSNDYSAWLSGYFDTAQTGGWYGQSGSMVNGKPEGVEWVDGDWNQDGIVDANDYSFWLNSYLSTLPPLW